MLHIKKRTHKKINRGLQVKMPKTFFARLRAFDRRLVFVVLFVAAGSALLLATLAASPTFNLEAENASGTAATVLDPSASGGKFLKFGGGATTPPPSPGAGPTTYMTDAELDQIKAKIQAGQQPWKSAYDQLINKANGELGQAALSVVDNGGGHGLIGDRDTTEDYKLAIQMSEAIYNLSLAWRLSGNNQYGQKALSLINHWTLNDATYLEPDMGKTQGTGRLRVFITSNGIVYGADLIWAYSGWTAAQRTEFTQWTRTLGYSSRDNDTDGAGSLQNKENWRQSTIAVCAGFLQDDGLMNYVYNRYRALLPTWIGKPGTPTAGLMIQEYKRGNNGVGDGGISYSNYALNAMVQLAQISRAHGVDLYNMTVDQVNLKYALDTMANYNLAPSTWHYSPTTGITNSTFAYYEFAYLALNTPKYLQVVQIKGRPAILNYGIHGNITVTHGH